MFLREEEEIIPRLCEGWNKKCLRARKYGQEGNIVEGPVVTGGDALERVSLSDTSRGYFFPTNKKTSINQP